LGFRIRGESRRVGKGMNVIQVSDEASRG